MSEETEVETPVEVTEQTEIAPVEVEQETPEQAAENAKPVTHKELAQKFQDLVETLARHGIR